MTGTEVLTGRVRDRNGPWLSDRLLELGVELAHITICGDRPEDMTAQLRFMADQGVDLVITSGGLGPTADDMTIEMVAGFAGRPLVLDEDLEERIADILRPLMQRFRDLDFDAVRAANRKQALVPEGAHVIYPAGTAPGVVVPGRPAIVVLPGPPRELHAMWPQAVETDFFQEAIGGRTSYRQQTLRLFGIPESEIAETLRVAEEAIEGFEALEITTCLRRAEVEVVTRWEPPAQEAWDARARADRRAPRALAVLGGRLDDRRPGGGAAVGPLGRRRGVVHRRPDGGAPDGAPRVVGLLRRRRRGLLERGQGGAARRGPGPDRAPRRGVAGGG